MRRCCVALAVVFVALDSPLAQSAAQLGRVTFPNSGSPKAQAEFLRGVAWLHSFSYEDAIDAFRAAQKIDPNFAMASWGEALSFSQPLWFYEEVPEARAALAKLGPTPEARLAKARTRREQGFLRAVEALFGPGDTAARAAAYAQAMARVAADHPQDDEAQTFYALALLGTLPRGDASIPLRRQAGAIAERVFARSPNHPGAAHYILHAYDHVSLAPQGLAAARAYAKIAPAASHALHMPAHAFLQLGLWDEAASADQASWDAAIAWAKRRGLPVASRDFHSLSWLQYEWTQLGRFSKTKEAIAFVDDLDFGVAALERRADIGETGDGFGEERFGLAAEAFERGEIVAEDFDLDRAFEAEEGGVGNLDGDFGEVAEFGADAVDERRFVGGEEAGFHFHGQPRGVFAGLDGGAGAFLGADGDGGALDLGLLEDDAVDALGDLGGALDGRADGEGDVEVELALVHLRDEIAAQPRDDEKDRDEQRGQ